MPQAIHSPLIDWIAQAGDQLWAAGKADPSGVQMLTAWENMADPLVDAVEKAAADSKLYSDTQIASMLAQFDEAYQAYLNSEWTATITQQLALPPIFSVEYDVNRPTGQSSNSVVRGLSEKFSAEDCDDENSGKWIIGSSGFRISRECEIRFKYNADTDFDAYREWSGVVL